MTETSPTGNTPNKPTKTFSCVRCFERKVKCDKEHPCGGCVRSNVECVFRVPAPPRRKKKRTQEDILTERLNQYEQILQQKGIDIQNVPIRDDKSPKDTPAERNGSIGRSENQAASTPSEPDQRSFIAPKLIWEEGRSRYTENNLWTRVAEEFRTSQDAIHESSDEEDEVDESKEPEDNIEFALGWTPSSGSAKNYHPSPERIFVMWQIYLENVNPFTMLIHRPTVHQMIERATQDLEHVPRNVEVLMFAIYAAAIMSMQDRDVDNTFGEPKKALLLRYRTATKSALAKAKFMGTSDILVLQAFVIHLLATRDVYDGRTLWTLSGVALRIAEGMGLHKDGTALGLPPFKTEIRRRVWYQITTLDYRSAELSGSSKFRKSGTERVNTKPPLNVNDDDLWPDMPDFPTPHQKTTDMILCCLRYEFGRFWVARFQQRGPQHAESIWENYSSNKSIEEHDAAIDDLERLLEEKYVRYCDPSIPIELMASLVARTATNTMRLMAHHPRRWSSDNEIPESERKLHWNLCMKILEGYIMCITYKSLQRYVWHTSFYFQWQALIYLLDCVRADPLMPAANDAWKHVDDIFECHPNFITDTKKAIHVAVGSLCLKAYSAREQAFKKDGRFLPARPPDYIQVLRKQRDAAQAKQAERKAKAASRSHSQSGPGTSASNDLANMMGFEAANQMSILPHQQPLPVFQPPISSNAQTFQQPPQQRPQQPQQPANSPQQPVPFWFDSFNAMSQLTGADMDWMMMQDPPMDQGNQVDWNQWDFLLQDEGGNLIR